MTLCRTLLFATVVVAAPFVAHLGAHAQFGGMPGMPGTMPGGMPGGGGGGMPGGAPGGFGGPPQQGPPPACKDLLALRDETHKHGMAIQKANEKKATVQEACKLFKSYLAAESKFIKGLEDNSRTCGVPGEVIKQVKESHAKAGQVGKQVCDAATQAATRPAGPSLSDALGAGPVMPDSSKSSAGSGAFDTLNGNILSR